MATKPLPVDRRWQQLRKLTEVSRALTYAMSLDEVLDLTVKRAAELLQAQKSVLMLTNEEGLLSVRASHGLDAAACEKFREPLQETIITRLQGLLGNDAKEQFLGVPLVVGGEVTGLLAVARPGPIQNVDEEEWLLSALADQAAVALEKTRLDETAQFRERLIGIVSHDLRNPISAILLSTAGLMRRDDLDPQVLRTAVRIQTSAERASRMIRDLLDFTQARLGGGIQVRRQPGDVHTIVRAAVEEQMAAQPDRHFEVTHAGDARGNWDVDRLAQVVGNLLSNAVHYSPAGTPIRVHTEGNARGVVITIQNGGTPIPPARLSQLFEPMQRATAELSSVSRSVGLGLYIVKHLVEAHGGKVSVTSSEAEGTTLRVELPRP